MYASIGSNGSTPTRNERASFTSPSAFAPSRNVRFVASVSRANDFSSSWSSPDGIVSPGDAATAVPPGARTPSKRGPWKSGLSVT